VSPSPARLLQTSVFQDMTFVHFPGDRADSGDRRFRAIFDAAAIGIALIDLTGRIAESNPALQQLLGYTAEELHDKTFVELTFPEDLGDDPALIGAIFAGLRDSRTLEKRYVRKDGSIIWARVAASVVRHADGSPQHGIAMVVDITGRKALEEQLLQSQKLEAIARLAGGVAHDFNNLLTVIRGYSEFILSKVGPDDPLRGDAEEIQHAAGRATLLTRQLVAFSRKQSAHPQTVDVNSVVRSVEKLLCRLIGEDVALTVRTTDEACAVRVDPGHLEQVLMNLALNARDAMPEGGSLMIETGEEFVTTAANMMTSGSIRRHVRISMLDTGAGIPEDIRGRIFEPFFTTKTPAKGTGLGLSMVYGIVSQAGGLVRVRSEPGHGTAVDVLFPCAGDLIPSDVPVTPTPIPTGTETILLAEDDGAVRRLATRTLTNLGYHMLVAESGEKAIELARAYPERIHAVISDVVMPGMSGPSLVSRLEASRPDIRVLYVSGYTDERMEEHGVFEEGLSFLRKPFTPEEIARALRAVLD
jgi:two-component system cell cycle sensor histidine kinase/response regulator CckA